MQENKKTGMLAFLVGIGAALVALFLGTVAYVYLGGYNIAATEEHSSFTRWVLDTNFHQSVEGGGASVSGPEQLTPEMAAAGASPYKEMCQHCHSAPGGERASWAEGMRPLPPHLTEAAAEWEPSEVFWLVKHGAKMTGMPAFGPNHSDEDIWNIVAFVKRLPAMTSQEYERLTTEAGSSANAPPVQQ
ncbi:Di-heme cytochrome c (Class I) [Pseudorhizobium banfieldiae]|uniref:Di-heme cytochrome c (Class I) n=1 Tax=Pseudorhizobium banfieldiae TaxID=1125847 RepID=L0NBA7_9HYPH|nr:cytochrome c [Pseudorhizobium banfieldiae]CAD6602063.1 cytochrome c [arsenite-oxidising bacterium NT-25]CCF18355.1 Di-heme cytochrome c (Class I) [Pseudorhizobium banfieldiae]